MGLTGLLFAPLHMAKQGAHDLSALAEATRNLPRFERALNTQLSALLARVGEVSLHVEQVPAPVLAIARELPPIGVQVGALQRDVAHVATVIDGLTSAVTTIDPRLMAIEGVVDRLSTQLAGVQASLDGLSATVKDAAEHLPDADEEGVLVKAREVFSGAGTAP